MSSDRKPPVYQISAKRKGKDESKPEYINNVFVVWDSNGRLSMTAGRPFHERPGVKHIVMTDGTIVDPEDYWFNFNSPRPASAPKKPPPPDDDGGALPF